MKCLLCGKESKKVLCNSCINKADEELCYRITNYNYNNSDNDLWKELSEELEKKYLFKDYALDVADIIGGARADYIKIICFSMSSSYVGVPKDCREYAISHVDDLLSNDLLDDAEKNRVRSLLLGIYVAEKEWDKAYDYVKNIKFDKKFLEPYLIVSDFMIKIRDYKNAHKLLKDAGSIFKDDNDSKKINDMLKDCNERQSGTKNAYKPSKAEEIKVYYEFLDNHDIEHDMQSNGSKRNKVKVKDFKPYHYHMDDTIPDTYVALWLTSEFYLKQREVVEINAVRVKNRKEVDSFHSFVRPVNMPKSFKNVSKEDVEKAKPIIEVFTEFMSFLGDDVIAIAGVEEQKNYLSRLARYSKLDHIDNLIFDVIEYGEDLLDESFTRDSILGKYKLKEGKDGMDKAKVTYKLTEKMRG